MNKVFRLSKEILQTTTTTQPIPSEAIKLWQSEGGALASM